jgi:glycosyltransferase involved in cell wall biosynthesis
LSQSVSFILPVRNLQYGLRDRVQMILEILGELTDTFDVLIVDYGSRDETREVALDLVREFPQVDYLDRGKGGDLFSAVEAGIYRTTGEIVFIHDPTLALGLTALHGLWQMRDDDDLVMAQSRTPADGRQAFLDLPSGRRAPASARSSIQMIRRCAIRELPSRQQRSSFAVDRVTRTDLMDEPAESLRLPKLLTRLKRLTNS